MTIEWSPLTSTRKAIYIAFDGDNDMWAYAYMKGWNINQRVDFQFHNAHDLNVLTSRAGEERVKRQLRGRFAGSRLFILLVGEKTRFLYKFVRWEIECALNERLPIVVVNLNDKRVFDGERCPAILRDCLAVHVSFNAAIIQHALTQWPRDHVRLLGNSDGPRWYTGETYARLGL